VNRMDLRKEEKVEEAAEEGNFREVEEMGKGVKGKAVEEVAK